MDRGRIFAYCERGLDPGFWAEPLNALTNAAFIVAGLAALWLALRVPRGRAVNAALASLIIVIGLGSFAFHTLATRSAALADVVPIGLFMLAYFALAMRRFLRLSVLWTVAATLGFAVLLAAVPGWLRFGADQLLAGDAAVFARGFAPYLPALAAMLAIGAIMVARGQETGRTLLLAGCVFAVSLTFRALDPVLCDASTVSGQPWGTHFLWHLLNAVTLFTLMLGAIRHGGKAAYSV